MATESSAFKETRRAIREHKTARSSLLRLPAELRNAIYKFALPDRIGRILSVTSSKDLIRPPILRVSRQIRRDTTSLWYPRVIFTARLADIPVALTWIASLPTDALSLLRHLHFTAVVKCHCEHKLAQHRRNELESTLGLCLLRCALKSGCGPHVDDDGVKVKGKRIVEVRCPTAKEVDRRVEKALDRIGDWEERVEIEREDLMALVRIFDDAQRRPLKLCMGRSAWLR